MTIKPYINSSFIKLIIVGLKHSLFATPFIIFFISCQFAMANSHTQIQSIVVNNDPNLSKLVFPYAKYLQDINADLTINDIEKSSDFKPIENNAIRFYRSAGNYWFSFSIENKSNDSLRFWLECDNLRLDNIQLYTRTDNGFDRKEIGIDYANPKWLIQERLNTLPIDIKAGETQHYYMRVSSTNSISFASRIYADHANTIRSSSLIGGLGMIYGVLLALLIYSINIYISINDRTFVYFIMLLAGVIIQVAANQGSLKIFWPGNTSVVLFSTIFGAMLSLLANALFLRRFLYLDYHHPIIDKALLISGILPVIALSLYPWSNGSTELLIIGLSAISVIISIIASGMRLIDGYKPAIFPLVGQLVLLLPMTVILLLPESALPNFGVNNFLNLLVMCKMIIFACGLSSRIYRLNRKLSLEISEREGREKQMLQAQRIARYGDWSWDTETNQFNFSENAYAILPSIPNTSGIALEKLLEKASGKERKDLIYAFNEARTNKKSFQTNFSLQHDNGITHYYHIQAGFPSDQHSPLVIGTIHDITEKQLADIAYQENEQRWRDLADSTFEAILIFQNYKIIDANQACETLTGYSPTELIGTDAELLFGKEKLIFLQEEITGNEETSFELKILSKQQSEISVELRSKQGLFNDDRVFILAIRDISERKRHEQELRQLGYYDNLTGLANRALFQERLQRAISKASRSHQKHALLFIDLDQFKNVNDSLGHKIGDLLLVEVGKRIKQRIRETDTAARFGGDEFAILIEDVSAPYAAAKVAEDLLTAMAEHIEIDDYTLLVTPSIGIAMYPSDGDDESELLRKADTAMYHAKGQGRNNYQFYTEQLNERVVRRMDLESELRLAIEREEFFLNYQPKVCIKNGHILGAEALLRWKSKKHGMVSPLEFITIAEETGLIWPIGEWVLNKACLQAQEWVKTYPTFTSIAVNISGIQFKHINLVDSVAAVLEKTNLPSEKLELEITENAIIDNAEEAIKTMGELKQLGVKLSLDDFGTGYSSLNYLKRFPVDSLKIDRSFVAEIVSNETDLKIAENIVRLAHDLKLNVVAEGVETIEQLDIMREMNCDQLQGYIFSKPLSNEDFSNMLSNDSNLYTSQTDSEIAE